MCERIIGSTFMSCQAPPKATPPLEPAQNRSAAHKSLNRKVDLKCAIVMSVRSLRHIWIQIFELPQLGHDWKLSIFRSD
jgi:hypothetical protein